MAENTPPPPLGIEADESPEIRELAAALAKAQAKIAHADKSREAPVNKDGSKKRRYATLADVMDAARPALTAHGLAVVQHPSSGGGGLILTTWLLHESGQWMRSRLAVPVAANAFMSDVQALGSAITYARRYAYAAVAGVAVEDDDGEAAGRTDDGARQMRDRELPATFPFGTLKDQPIQGAAVKDLEWFAKITRENIADPAKANFKDRNASLLAALERELDRQRKPDVLPSGAQLLGDKPMLPIDPYEGACTLIRAATTMERVSQVMRRAHDSGKMTPEQLKGLDLAADKRLSELKAKPARAKTPAEQEPSEGELDAMRHEGLPGDEDASF